MNIYILLTSVGYDAGPFDLYSDTDGYLAAFESNISLTNLLEGFASTNCPDGTVYVRIFSDGVCRNFIDVNIEGVPIPLPIPPRITINSWYYGRYNSPGGVVPIPTAVDINVLSGTLRSTPIPSNPIPIPFNSLVDDFLWFAISIVSGTKSTWYVDVNNNGVIGGPVSAFGNLFPDPEIVTYNNIQMYLYISTARTNITTITMS